MAKLPSFGILVHGPAKAGKSTILLAAASVTGYGREQDLPNFRATDAAFGEIPAAFNDSLLPVNELGLLKGSAVEKYLRFRDFTFGFAEGRGTTYSKLAPIDGVGCRIGMAVHLVRDRRGTANEIARDAREIRMAGSRCDGLIWPPLETELPIFLIASRKMCQKSGVQSGSRTDAQRFATGASAIMVLRFGISLSLSFASQDRPEGRQVLAGNDSSIMSSTQTMTRRPASREMLRTHLRGCYDRCRFWHAALVGKTGSQMHRKMLSRCAARTEYRDGPAARWAEHPACEDARLAEGEWLWLGIR